MYRGATFLLGVSLLGITSIGLTACASSRNDSTSSAAAPDVVCVTERQTGTHFSQRICRTRSQMEAERAAAKETIRDIGDHEPPPLDHSH
jgi:hypothetical protein